MRVLGQGCSIVVCRLEPSGDEHLLAAEEQARAARFVSDVARWRYVSARVMLRRLCAEYTGIAARAVRFEAGPAGKPHLLGSDVEFNLSHAEDLAVYAFARGQAVGVDVERVRALPDMDEVAAVFMRGAELAVFRGLGGEARERFFFKMWTRREASAKLGGEGLGAALESGAEQSCWLYEFEPLPGAYATLAMEREPVGVDVQARGTGYKSGS